MSKDVHTCGYAIAVNVKDQVEHNQHKNLGIFVLLRARAAVSNFVSKGTGITFFMRMTHTGDLPSLGGGSVRACLGMSFNSTLPSDCQFAVGSSGGANLIWIQHYNNSGCEYVKQARHDFKNTERVLTQLAAPLSRVHQFQSWFFDVDYARAVCVLIAWLFCRGFPEQPYRSGHGQASVIRDKIRCFAKDLIEWVVVKKRQFQDRQASFQAVATRAQELLDAADWSLYDFDLQDFFSPLSNLEYNNRYPFGQAYSQVLGVVQLAVKPGVGFATRLYNALRKAKSDAQEESITDVETFVVGQFDAVKSREGDLVSIACTFYFVGAVSDLVLGSNRDADSDSDDDEDCGGGELDAAPRTIPTCELPIVLEAKYLCGIFGTPFFEKAKCAWNETIPYTQLAMVLEMQQGNRESMTLKSLQFPLKHCVEQNFAPISAAWLANNMPRVATVPSKPGATDDVTCQAPQVDQGGVEALFETANRDLVEQLKRHAQTCTRGQPQYYVVFKGSNQLNTARTMAFDNDDATDSAIRLNEARIERKAANYSMTVSEFLTKRALIYFVDSDFCNHDAKRCKR